MTRRTPTSTLAIASLFAACLLAPLAAPAHAQATRTWVSGVGDDANPCSRTAPCKTFMGAASKTSGGGAISTVDPGGFGALTITKGLSIVSDAGVANVLVTTASAITVSAGASDDIVLSGLTLQGASGAQNGIHVVSARSVQISNCVISGFQAAGIAVEGDVQVFVSDCTVTDNAVGILAKAGTVFLNRVNVVRSQESGARADGKTAGITLNNCAVTNNGGTGLDAANGGTIASFGNNAVWSNTLNGKPTELLTPM